MIILLGGITSRQHKNIYSNNQYGSTTLVYLFMAIRRDVPTHNCIKVNHHHTMMEIQDCLILTHSGNQTFGIGTHEVSSGKWYFEVWIKAENGNNVNIGIGTQGDINSLNNTITVIE